MFKFRLILASLALLTAQQVFAEAPATDLTTDARPCFTVAKACKAAGFVRKGEDNKRFWKNCFRPILLGQTVNGVKVDPSAVKACREAKVNKIKQELKDLQAVRANNS